MSRVLGHRSVDTTTNYYTGFESAAAVRQFNKVILGLRDDKDTAPSSSPAKCRPPAAEAPAMIVTRCLPVLAWPEPDQVAWAAAISSGDLLERDGLAAHWSPATRRIIVKGYGRWIAWLTETGQLDSLAPLAARVTPERIAEYVRHLRERNASSTVAARVRDLREALRVMAPGADLVWLRRVANVLGALASPARPKRQRMRTPRELFALGIRLMHQAEADEPRRSPRDRAVLYRDGLMIALLSSCPIRLRNLLGMMIGQHLMRRGEVYWVVFQEQETKTRRPIEVPLPQALTAAIDRYIEAASSVAAASPERWCADRELTPCGSPSAPTC